MSDLIRREDALLYDIIPSAFARQYVMEMLDTLYAKLNELSTAEPKRKMGKWIDEGFYADGHSAHAFRCSECGGHIIEYDVDPFCRWCGADMRGEKQ